MIASLVLTTAPPTVHDKAGRGDWIRTSDLHTPSVMRYQAALRPDLAAASRQAIRQGKAGGWRMVRRRRKSDIRKWVGRLLLMLLAVPALYLIAAFIGSVFRSIEGGSSQRMGRPSTSPIMASTPTSSCQSRRRASIGSRVVPAWTWPRLTQACGGFRSGRARSGFISIPDVVGHYAAHDLVRADGR